MAKDDTTHFLRFSLIAVFLVAMLTILGIVALVTQHGASSVAPAQSDDNTVGLGGANIGGNIVAGVYQYLSYQPEDRAVNLASRTGYVQVAITPWGNGTLVCGGRSFQIGVNDMKSNFTTILVDTNGDWSYDQKVAQGEFFSLKCGR